MFKTNRQASKSPSKSRIGVKAIAVISVLVLIFGFASHPFNYAMAQVATGSNSTAITPLPPTPAPFKCAGPSPCPPIHSLGKDIRHDLIGAKNDFKQAFRDKQIGIQALKTDHPVIAEHAFDAAKKNFTAARHDLREAGQDFRQSK